MKLSFVALSLNITSSGLGFSGEVFPSLVHFVIAPGMSFPRTVFTRSSTWVVSPSFLLLPWLVYAVSSFSESLWMIMLFLLLFWSITSLDSSTTVSSSGMPFPSLEVLPCADAALSWSPRVSSSFWISFLTLSVLGTVSASSWIACLTASWVSSLRFCCISVRVSWVTLSSVLVWSSRLQLFQIRLVGFRLHLGF